MSIVEISNLSKKYGNGDNEVIAVNNVNLSIKKGEFVAIIGSSGSGKSTFLHMVGGLDKPSKGTIQINGILITDLSEKKLTLFRRRNIGFVFQSFNLVPTLNVEENIKLPCGLDGKVVDIIRFDNIVHRLKIDNKLNSKINQLSGGQIQRVAIARALINEPDIILADEPTGNLDSKNSQEVMKLFLDASHEYNQTVVMITHDDRIAAFADRIIKIEDGVLYE